MIVSSNAVELDAEAPSLDSESKEVGPSDLEIDPILEQELSQNGFRSTRRTKLVVTIGPSCESEEALESMMLNGMNVARLNASHGTHEWHARMIARIRRLNAAKGYSVAVMMDTEGSEVHTATLPAPIKADKGESIVFTVRDPATDAGTPAGAIAVSYDAFAEDVRVGDVVVVDGGMVSLLVVRKQGPDVHCEVLDPGLILSRANVTFRREGAPVRARNAALPVLSAKDWLDIDFALSQRVDFIAVSFVKTADVIHNLRSYAESRVPRAPGVVAKVESADSLPNLPAIVQAADAVMVARGDLGAQINMEDVPAIQKEVVLRCRAEGKPVIVASHLLQSMLELPTPTRAEVSDVADAVRQGADALMLSGESAAGLHPQKALEVVRATAARVEAWNREDGQLSSGAYSYAAMLAGSAGGGSARVGGGWTHAQGETAGNGMCETGSNADRVGSSFPGASADCASTPSRSKSSAQREAQETCAAAAAAANALGARAIFVYTRRGVTAGYLSRFRPDCPIF
ncbi:pyruvate kinase, partial [Helicosporidium sp. ATCC 50920]